MKTKTKTNLKAALGTKQNPPIVEMIPPRIDKRHIAGLVTQYRKLHAQAAQVKSELDAITDQLKSTLNAAQLSNLQGANWEIKLTSYTQSRIDSKALQINFPDIYSQFERKIPCQRLTVK